MDVAAIGGAWLPGRAAEIGSLEPGSSAYSRRDSTFAAAAASK
jgi:hypothetical protein